MTQQVSSPPEQTEEQPVSQPLPPIREPDFSRPGIIIWLLVIGILLLVFAGQTARYLPDLLKSSMKSTMSAPYVAGIVPANSLDILQVPGQVSNSPSHFPISNSVLYEQRGGLYLLPAGNNQAQMLNTPGYIYNRSVLPLVTPDGKVLYSGNGLWLTSIRGGASQQIAQIPVSQVITSLALSHDGTTVAWSTEPLNGDGSVAIYAGPLVKPVLVYQHSASDCPCFRVFSFLQGTGTQGDSTLLLTDDRGDHQAVQYGLWSLNLSQKPVQKLHQVLSSAQPTGPLLLTPDGTTLLYSSNEGFVPATTDGSAPGDAASITYANSLDMATLSGNSPQLDPTQVVLPEQQELSNLSAYRWITTPRFAPDGHTLIYVQFSSDVYAPYRRHSALYSVQVNGSGSHLQVGMPQLLATSSAYFIELGGWLNPHMLTFYADGSLYAFDIQTGAYTQLIDTNFYMRIVAIGSQG